MIQLLAIAVFTTTPAAVEISGVRWHNSIEQAKVQARSTGKPILHLQMFGKLNDEFC